MLFKEWVISIELGFPIGSKKPLASDSEIVSNELSEQLMLWSSKLKAVFGDIFKSFRVSTVGGVCLALF